MNVDDKFISQFGHNTLWLGFLCTLLSILLIRNPKRIVYAPLLGWGLAMTMLVFCDYLLFPNLAFVLLGQVYKVSLIQTNLFMGCALGAFIVMLFALIVRRYMPLLDDLLFAQPQTESSSLERVFSLRHAMLILILAGFVFYYSGTNKRFYEAVRQSETERASARTIQERFDGLDDLELTNGSITVDTAAREPGFDGQLVEFSVKLSDRSVRYLLRHYRWQACDEDLLLSLAATAPGLTSSDYLQRRFPHCPKAFVVFKPEDQSMHFRLYFPSRLEIDLQVRSGSGLFCNTSCES